MTLVNVWDIFGWHDVGVGRPGRLFNIPQGAGWSPTRRTTWPQTSAVPRPRKPVSAETNQLTKRKIKNKKPKRNQTFNSRKVTLSFSSHPAHQETCRQHPRPPPPPPFWANGCWFPAHRSARLPDAGFASLHPDPSFPEKSP